MMEFGELVEPETRSFWENYDTFEEENHEAVKLEWKWMDDDSSAQDNVTPIDRFYVFEGRQIFDFLNAILLKNTMPICQLENYKTAIYKLPDSNAVICLTEGNDIDRTAQITEMLRPWMRAAKDTYAFAFQPNHMYHSERQFDRRCFIRSICERQPIDDDKLKKLIEPMEDCNMISGVAAGVATYCHMNDLPIGCYAIYIDCPVIDSVVSPLIIECLNGIGLKTAPVYVFKNLNTSNLYI